MASAPFVKRTYSRKAKMRHQENNYDVGNTSEEEQMQPWNSRQVDPFDQLLKGITPLREKNILKRKVRMTYNRNSSFESSAEGSQFPFPHKSHQTSTPLKNDKKTSLTNVKRSRNIQPNKSNEDRSILVKGDASSLNSNTIDESSIWVPIPCSNASSQRATLPNSIRKLRSRDVYVDSLISSSTTSLSIQSVKTPVIASQQCAINRKKLKPERPKKADVQRRRRDDSNKIEDSLVELKSSFEESASNSTNSTNTSNSSRRLRSQDAKVESKHVPTIRESTELTNENESLLQTSCIDSIKSFTEKPFIVNSVPNKCAKTDEQTEYLRNALTEETSETSENSFSQWPDTISETQFQDKFCCIDDNSTASGSFKKLRNRLVVLDPVEASVINTDESSSDQSTKRSSSVNLCDETQPKIKNGLIETDKCPVASFRRRTVGNVSAKDVSSPVWNSFRLDDPCNPIPLPRGKWRRSLSIWQRNNGLKHSCDVRSTQQPQQPQPQQSTKPSTVIVSGLSKDKLSFVSEQTDDESRNLSALSLLDDQAEENCSNNSSSFSCFVVPEPSGGGHFDEVGLLRSNFVSKQQLQPQQQQQQQQQNFGRRRTSVLAPSALLASGNATNKTRDLSGFLELLDLNPVPKLSARDVILRRCGQSEPKLFSELYPEETLRNCRKIGEGVYGEVFMNKNQISGQAVVFKIIPIEGITEINGESQKKFDEILSEIVIAMELCNLRNGNDFMTSGFVDVLNVRCLQGRYPEHMIDLWELYRDNCGTENDHPEIFDDNQLYIVLELANGGQDLEAFHFHNALQSYSAFLQTVLTLAVAEQKFQFEHRDLHWGNILLAPTENETVTFKLNGQEIAIPSHGVKVTIIDYTLSRIIFDGCCLFNDLANDNELFSATGDYQFDIYRFMKTRLDNCWERYEPYTNILWLHYTIDKLINGARYRNTKSRKHRTAIHDMMQLRDELLEYKSASSYVKCLF